MVGSVFWLRCWCVLVMVFLCSWFVSEIWGVMMLRLLLVWFLI